MAEIRRVRKRGEKKQDSVQSTTPDQEILSISREENQEENSSFWLNREQVRQNQGHFTTRDGISEISAELADDRHSGIHDANYWDETHNWGCDDDYGSDDYWHFVGSYE
ncbi:MAG: hypothetical protein QNJ70_21295 [Xenococcaceae cyanobacterium MO_207.B15]|nr:hypothetical protein [Xenococcaceae cyanobacterium MO_207.B15]